jgi:hypothetical protein
MYQVRTFTAELRPMYTIRELEALDREVNAFLAQDVVKRLVSVQDTCTAGDSGQTIGLIRVVGYET